MTITLTLLRRPGVRRPRAALTGALLAALLAGCASTKDQVIPSGGPTMLEIYRAHQMRSGIDERPGSELRRSARRPAAGDDAAREGADATLLPVSARPVAAGYAREEAAALDQRFGRIPNPDLVMYVFPHITPSGAPVPGYVTVLPMYEHVEYALPGEVGPSAQRLSGGQ